MKLVDLDADVFEGLEPCPTCGTYILPTERMKVYTDRVVDRAVSRTFRRRADLRATVRPKGVER